MHACFIAVNFSIHTGGGGEWVRKVSTVMRRHKKFAFSPYFPHLPTPLPINNDHSLNLFIYDTYDNTIKNLFYCFKASGALCWFEMGCYDTDLFMLRIPQLDLPQKTQDQAIISS